MKKKSPPKKKNKMETPLGVKIISVLYYISAAILLLLGLAFMIGGSFLGPVLSEFLGNPESSSTITGIAIALGILFIIFAVLSFFIGKELWKGRNWARVVVVIFSILGFIGALLSSFFTNEWAAGIVNLIINGFIGWYFLFKENVKKFFLNN